MPVTPGLSEAAPDAIVTYLKSKITDLDARLDRDDQTPGLTPTAAGQIYRGDPKIMAPSAWWVTVVGANANGREIQSTFELMGESGGRGFYNKWWGTISAYVSIDTTFDDDSFVSVATRDRLLSRLADWLRIDCFNQQATLLLTLTSQEFSSGLQFDQLKGNVLEYIDRGEAPKGYGETDWVPCIRAHFVGDLA